MANPETPKDEMTWMLVEDDSAIRDVIEMMCELWGFKVVSFRDGFQATDFQWGPITVPDPSLYDPLPSPTDSPNGP